MQITIDHKTNDAKTTNLRPLKYWSNDLCKIFNMQGFENFSILQKNLEIKKKLYY